MNLGHLVSIVRESRSMTAMVFPLPDVDGCVDYAITEAGEYLDAILREQRTTDKRNNSKQSDIRKEWGQCGYMIASAMIQIDDCPMFTLRVPCSIYTVLVALCFYRMSPSGAVEWLTDALSDWESICDDNGWNPVELMAETCNAFERKHLPELFEVA